MIQVDLPVAFGSGTLLAAALEHHTDARTWPYLYQRALAKNLIFQTLFALWLPVYLLVNYFGFQTSHMFWHGESLTDYPALLPVFLILYFVANIAGFQTGAWLVLQGRARLARLIFVAAFTYFALWMAFQPYRTLSLGTFDEWQVRDGAMDLDRHVVHGRAGSRRPGVLRRDHRELSIAEARSGEAAPKRSGRRREGRFARAASRSADGARSSSKR